MESSRTASRIAPSLQLDKPSAQQQRPRTAKKRKGICDQGQAQGSILGREDGREAGRQEGREVGRQEGREVGRQEGRKKMLHLIDLMVENGEVDRIPKLSKSPEFLEEMLVKYQLA